MVHFESTGIEIVGTDECGGDILNYIYKEDERYTREGTTGGIEIKDNLEFNEADLIHAKDFLKLKFEL